MALTLDQNLISFLLNQPLMQGIGETDLLALMPYLEVKSFKPGDTIFNEGDLSNDLYIVFEGEVSLVKQTSDKLGSYVIGNLTPGQVFGEMSFIDDSPRSCSVVTQHNLILVQLARKERKAFSVEVQGIYEKIVRNLAKLTIRRVREANDKFAKTREVEVRKLQVHTDFTKLLLNTALAILVACACSGAIFLLSINLTMRPLYTQLPANVSHLLQDGFFLINWLAVASILPAVLYFISQRPVALKMFGFSLENRGRLVAYIFGAASASVMLSCVLFMLVKNVFYELFFRALPDVSVLRLIPTMCSLFLYPLYVLATEFILRGVLQTLLQRSFLNATRWYAVCYPAMLVAACNAYFGFGAMLLVLLLHGICGLIYAKEKNIFFSATVHLLMGLLLKYMGMLSFSNLT